MDSDDRNAPAPPADRTGLQALEVIFLGAVGLVVLAAFITAFRYKLVSSRTPFVIMVPLLALIGVQAQRLLRQGAARHLAPHLRAAFAGDHAAFGKLWRLAAAFLGLMLVIVVFGHMIGIVAFMLLLTLGMARERPLTGVLVTAGAALAIFLLFEYGFGIGLYRGLLFRWLAGYHDF